MITVSPAREGDLSAEYEVFAAAGGTLWARHNFEWAPPPFEADFWSSIPSIRRGPAPRAAGEHFVVGQQVSLYLDRFVQDDIGVATARYVGIACSRAGVARRELFVWCEP